MVDGAGEARIQELRWTGEGGGLGAGVVALGSQVGQGPRSGGEGVCPA